MPATYPEEAKTFRLLGHDPTAAWGGGSLVQVHKGHAYVGAVGGSSYNGPEGFTVVTPHLTARVTGTEFTVRTTRAETVVELYSGRVEVTPAAAGAAPIAMQPGERVSGTQIWIGRSPCARSLARCDATFLRVAFFRWAGDGTGRSVGYM